MAETAHDVLIASGGYSAHDVVIARPHTMS
jgi:hypothetical protein